MHTLTNALDKDIIDWLRWIGRQYPHRFLKKKDYGDDVRMYFGPEIPGFGRFESAIRSLLDTDPKSLVCAYERQYEPTPLHVDPEPMQHTLIIPLHDDPGCRTIAWKQTFDTVDQWHRFVESWQPHGLGNDLSQKELLDHCYDENKQSNMADYLDLDGIFVYEVGSVGVFSARQVHASSNWRRLPNYVYKDFVVVHTYH